jgi:hypothetical protein
MAGILFTDERMVLAGCRSNGVITGIGGKRKQDETPYKTAVRETLEELFELEVIPEELMNDVYANITSYNVISGPYTIFVCTFHDLKEIIDMVRSYTVKSAVYDELPRSLEELIFNRHFSEKSEFTHLVLLPYFCNTRIENYFLKDIKMFLNTIP